MRSELERLLAKYPNPKDVRNAPMLDRKGNYLREAAPEVYGFLGGAMGTAPDEFEGSVMDPNSERVALGAKYGFPIGTLAQMLPFGGGVAAGKGAVQGSKAVQRGVIKAPGGNWRSGSGSPEWALSNLKTSMPGSSFPEQIELLTKELPGFKDPTARATLQTSIDSLQRQHATNSWIDKKLKDYVKNDMATERDPVRALAERGILHFQPQPQIYGPGVNTTTARTRAGFPKEGMGQSDLAKNWEDISDRVIYPEAAGDLLRTNGNARRLDPWLTKVLPETPVHQWRTGHQTSNLGFDHLIDELRNATNPNSGLPADLLWKYSDLNKVTVPQAVERVAKINDWRVAQKAEADLMKANNAATVLHKEYPEAGMRWVELKQPKPTGKIVELKDFEDAPGLGQTQIQEALEEMAYDAGYDPGTREFLDFVEANRPVTKVKGDEARKMLEDALKYEGDIMGHCVGGYCEGVLEGRQRIFSLRDAKGQPHVTIETRAGGNNPEAFGDAEAYDAMYDAYRQAQQQGFQGDEAAFIRQAYPDKALDTIVQIKGKANRKPKDDYLPYVQDFVRSGKWSDVGDFQNAGLIRRSNLLQREQELMPELGDFLTMEEIQSMRKGQPWTPIDTDPEFAAGGLVRTTDYNPAHIDNLVAQFKEEHAYG